MSTKSLEVVNIHEQRRCLDKLDEEIEKALTDLDSLNSYTMIQAKKAQKKPPVNKFYTPARAPSLNVQDTPDVAVEESVGIQSTSNPIKIINQNGSQQLAPNLQKNDNDAKEVGYASVKINGQNEQKENIIRPEGSSSEKKSALPANFWVTISEKRKQKYPGTEKKEGSSTADTTLLSKENTIGSYGSKDTLNASSNQKPLMEYHKLSNLDLPKEIIHGNSKPEHFFGFQQNLRKQGTYAQQNSPKNAQVKQVVNRLLQYGREKEERHKAIKEGKDVDNRKKLYQTKKSKSFVYQDEQSYFYEEEDVQPNNEVVDENENAGVTIPQIQNNSVLPKTGSLQPSEITPSQMNQALGAQYDSRSFSAKLKDQSDPFYQLYKEGNKNSMARATKDQNSEGFDRSLTPTKKQAAVTWSNTVMHQNSVDEQVKTLVRPKANVENSDLCFRPKLSKKSMEIAAKLGDSFQRLVDTSINKATHNKKKLLKEMDTNLTFKPKINKLSTQLDEQFKANVFNGDDLHRWDQLYLMKDKYNIDKELKKLERERIEKENDECTFHPKLNRVTSSMFRDKSVSFPDRVSAWKEMKDRKLRRERSAILEKEIEECTFVPATLSPVRLGASRSAVNLNDLSQMSAVKGLDNHFEKIDRANRMKRELEAKQEKYSGKCWKRQITVPKEFHLTKKGGPQSPFSHSRSMANLDISTEEKIYKNVVFLETIGEGSPQALRKKDMCNNSWLGKTIDNSITNYDNFGNTIVKLHYELQRMEI